MSSSGLLVVTIQMPLPEFENDPPDLVSVVGATSTSKPGALSDVEWFLEEWNTIGLDLLGEVPADGNTHTFRGRLLGRQDYWGEWDLEWVEEVHT